MARQTVEVTNGSGLHARPASEFTKIASSLKCEVFIEKDGKKMNAKSILGVLSLAIVKDSKIDIITEGEGEEEGLEKLVKFVNELSE